MLSARTRQIKWIAQIEIGSIATVIRAFRVGRIFRIAKKAKRIRQLFETLILTLPALGNIAGLLMLVFFVFSVIGVNLFATVAYGDSINHHANFNNFFMAFLILCRCCTGESWNVLMIEFGIDAEGCTYESYDPDWCVVNGNREGCTPLNGCGNNVMASIYFPTFTLMVSPLLPAECGNNLPGLPSGLFASGSVCASRLATAVTTDTPFPALVLAGLVRDAEPVCGRHYRRI